jgi:Cdc25 family phosphatase
MVVDYMDPAEVLALIEAKKQTVVIVDVRDEDRSEGFIRGSEHIASATMTEVQLGQLHDRVQAGSMLVFHCMFSQVRGPKAARRFSEVVAARAAASGVAEKVQVRIMRGGFMGWKAQVGPSRPDTMHLPW